MIDSDRCIELGFPIPRLSEGQREYVKRIALAGHELNTRQARYINIGNLHSVASDIKKSFPITIEHRQVFCPQSKKVEPNLVDVVYMTFEQRRQWQESLKQFKKRTA